MLRGIKKSLCVFLAAVMVLITAVPLYAETEGAVLGEGDGNTAPEILNGTSVAEGEEEWETFELDSSKWLYEITDQYDQNGEIKCYIKRYLGEGEEVGKPLKQERVQHAEKSQENLMFHINSCDGYVIGGSALCGRKRGSRGKPGEPGDP